MFATLAFGEKCDRHPVPKPRGADTRTHIMSKGKEVNEAALRMQKPSSDWWKPPVKPGEEKEQKEQTAEQKRIIRMSQTTSGVSQLLTHPPAQPTAQKNTYVMSSPIAPPQLTTGAATNKKQIDEKTGEVLYDPVQAQKNELAGLKMPSRLPAPVNMNEVVGKIDQPKPIPQLATRKTASEQFDLELALESRVDDHVATIKKSVEIKSNFGEPPEMSRTLQKLLQKHCTAATKEMSRDDFANAISVFHLNGLTDEEVDALFDRFDINENESVSFKEMSDGICSVRKIPAQRQEIRAMIRDIKQKILHRNPGDNAVRAFSKSFRLANKDNKNKKPSLNKTEFFNSLQKMGIRIKMEDCEKLVNAFDTDKDGTISLNEFLKGLRGIMRRRRKELVRKVYQILDENKDENISLDEISDRFNADKHPAVISGEKTKEEVFQDFISSWDQSGDSIITWKEFLNYYKDVSCGIDLDDYFELMIRNCWHISGGKGWAQNTTCRRVLVTFADGEQRVEEIKDDLGIGPKDLDKMRAKLDEQGVTNIKEIQLYS